LTRHLTDKERATLDLMAIGMTDREIARATGYTVGGVKSQVRQIFNKLGAVNRCHAVYLGFRRNLLNRTRTIVVPDELARATDKRNARREVVTR
jgi:DNA-binding CsgD family transcriptional regulator